MLRSIVYFVPILLVISLQARADIFKCVGLYNNGSPMHVIYDKNANFLNIDGDIHDIRSESDSNNALATQNYQNSGGKTVYISIINKDKDISLQVVEPQKEGKPKLIQTVHLACVK